MANINQILQQAAMKVSKDDQKQSDTGTDTTQSFNSAPAAGASTTGKDTTQQNGDPNADANKFAHQVTAGGGAGAFQALMQNQADAKAQQNAQYYGGSLNNGTIGGGQMGGLYQYNAEQANLANMSNNGQTVNDTSGNWIGGAKTPGWIQDAGNGLVDAGNAVAGWVGGAGGTGAGGGAGGGSGGIGVLGNGQFQAQEKTIDPNTGQIQGLQGYLNAVGPNGTMTQAAQNRAAPTMQAATTGPAAQMQAQQLQAARQAQSAQVGPMAQAGATAVAPSAMAQAGQIGPMMMVNNPSLGAAQNAQNVGMGPVAQQQTALTNQAQIDQAQQAQFRSAQTQLANQLLSQTQGGPSIAQLQGKQATEDALNQALALGAAQGHGMGASAAMRGIQANQANIAQKAAADSAILRLQEQQGAQNMLNQVAGGARTTDIGLAAQQAQFGQQANLANQGALNASNAANAQAQNQQQALQAQMMQQTALSNQAAQNQFGLQGAQLGLQAQLANQQSANTAAMNQAQLQQQTNLTNAGALNQRAAQQAELSQALNLSNVGAVNTGQLNQAQLQQQTALANQGATNQFLLQQGAYGQQANQANQEAQNQFAIQNALFGQQAAQGNQQANLQQTGLNDALTQYLTGQGFTAANAQAQNQLNLAQILANQNVGLQSVNQQAYASAAQRQQDTSKTLMNLIGSTVGAIV